MLSSLIHIYILIFLKRDRVLYLAEKSRLEVFIYNQNDVTKYISENFKA